MHQTVEFLIRHGSWVLFLWVLIEQLGAPVPSAPMLLAAGALIGLNHTSFAQAIAVVLAACSIADLSWYTLGRRRGNSVLRLLCRISLEPDSCVSTTEDRFRRLGVWSLVIAKFVPGLGALAAPMAGLSRMPIVRFLCADYLGVMLWSTVYLSIGYLFRAQLEDAGIFIGRLGGSLFTFVFLLASLWIGLKVWNRKRLLRRLRIARVTPEDVAERLSEFIILDLRSQAELEQEGLGLPGAIWFDRHDLAARHLEIPRDRDILLYCSCPNEATSARVALELQKVGIQRVRPLEGGYHGWRKLGLPVEPIAQVERR